MAPCVPGRPRRGQVVRLGHRLAAPLLQELHGPPGGDGGRNLPPAPLLVPQLQGARLRGHALGGRPHRLPRVPPQGDARRDAAPFSCPVGPLCKGACRERAPPQRASRAPPPLHVQRAHRATPKAPDLARGGARGARPFLWGCCTSAASGLHASSFWPCSRVAPLSPLNNPLLPAPFAKVFERDFAIYGAVEKFARRTTELFCLNWAPWKRGEEPSMYR